MSKQKWTILIIALVVVGIIVVKFVKSNVQPPIDINVAKTEGPAEARVQIVEFVDFQCPSCAYGYNILKGFVAKYPKDIRVQLKYFPLYKMHPHAKLSAIYSECAAYQGKFWPFVDRLFERQAQWSPMINTDKIFHDIAKDSGLNISDLNVCVVTESTMQGIEQDRQLGNTLAVSSTPTYFINNKMVVGVKSLQEELITHFPQGN